MTLYGIQCVLWTLIGLEAGALIGLAAREVR